MFDAVFEGHAFVERNPVSKAMTEVLEVIDEADVGREAQSLEGFYASVRRRAAGLTDPQARQKLIVELYDKFFRKAFPRTTQRLGIVYTPVEIVDFIIRSVNDVLEDEFGQTLGSEGVHILDPFTGTGTFITRLLQSGLIAKEDLERKYREEIHANELVLLAYYIAAINIETVFHAIAERADYLPFKGICLTDTFALHEGEDLRGKMDSWRIYHFQDTGPTSPFKKTSKIHDNRRLREDGSNLAAFLYLLSKQYSRDYEMIRKCVRLAVPFFEDFSLQPLELNQETLLLARLRLRPTRHVSQPFDFKCHYQNLTQL